MTDSGFLREQQIRIDRYRALEREVTDPLAARLLHDIILDFESANELDDALVHRGESARPDRGL
jgi:hypothetical protein